MSCHLVFLLQHSKAEFIPSKLKSIKKKINSNPRFNNMIVLKGLARPAVSVAVWNNLKAIWYLMLIINGGSFKAKNAADNRPIKKVGKYAHAKAQRQKHWYRLLKLLTWATDFTDHHTHICLGCVNMKLKTRQPLKNQKSHLIWTFLLNTIMQTFQVFVLLPTFLGRVFGNLDNTL